MWDLLFQQQPKKLKVDPINIFKAGDRNQIQRNSLPHDPSPTFMGEIGRWMVLAIPPQKSEDVSISSPRTQLTMDRDATVYGPSETVCDELVIPILETHPGTYYGI